MSDDIAYLPLADVVEAYRTRTLSPVEVVSSALERIARHNGKINAFTVVAGERALAEARQAERRWTAGAPLGPLDGVPISVKDTLMVKGFAFRRGSRATSEAPVAESAPVVDHALSSGATFLGITTTPEFGAGPVTISPLTGITRNPWDLRKNAGGSSGGAAAAVASGMGQAALSTDAGGSTRIPASLCGSVGFKPTGGRLPTYPPNVAGALSSPGIIARTVKDVAIVMNAVAKADPRDAEMLPPDGVDYSACLSDRLHSSGGAARKIRIAFSAGLGYAPKVDAQVATLVERAARHFESLGFIVEQADPGIDNPIDHFLTLFRSGFAYTMGKFSAAQRELIGPALREVVEQGECVTVAQYLAAQDARRALARKLHEFLSDYSLLLTPSVAVPAFTAERWTPEEFADFPDTRAWTPFGYVFNMTQQPAISVPCGLTKEGLPVGLQIIGARFADAEVLRAAHLYESTRPVQIGRPPLESA